MKKDHGKTRFTSSSLANLNNGSHQALMNIAYPQEDKLKIQKESNKSREPNTISMHKYQSIRKA